MEARAPQVDGRIYAIFLLKPSYQPRNGLKKFNGINNTFMAVFEIDTCLHPKSIYLRQHNSAIVNLPDQLCLASYSRQETNKFNYLTNHRYGLNLMIYHQTLHVFLLLILAGDVATNPGPKTKPNLTRHLARFWVLLHWSSSNYR